MKSILLAVFVFFTTNTLYARDKGQQLLPEATSSASSKVAVANVPATPPDPPGYTLGIGDVLTIRVLQPEQFGNTVTVSPDGTISFPYIDHMMARDKTVEQVQQEIQKQLSSGYFRYPSVIVLLKETRSRRFFVYGAVNKPGPYAIDNNSTVLRAISIAGGFTRFGSASRVKVLRPREGRTGYEMLQVSMKSVMDGNSDADLPLKSGDIIIVSEGIL